MYPDHMHEGKCLGEVAGYQYNQTLTFDGESFLEFPTIESPQERPEIIASGSTQTFVSRYAGTGMLVEGSAVANAEPVAMLSVYDGRAVGVGRVVTGSTFHHYVDINLTGDKDILSGTPQNRTGPDAAKGVGFNANPTVFNDIKAVFVNITNWLARPRPAISLILERSTFGQDEATVTPTFPAAILVTVDGLKPSQFPGGGIDSIAPGDFSLEWAPVITSSRSGEIDIIPTAVSSDDPTLPERLQRFTFTYRVELGASAFSFVGTNLEVPVIAELITPAAAAPLIDQAALMLVKSANPFMLDLDGGNTNHWLSSDLKVFRVVAGDSVHGVDLPDNATRAQAYSFINTLKDNITVSQFEALTGNQNASALSSMPTTTESGENVYNFAIARVRRNGTMLSAENVRVFFRIFNAQTTATPTYTEVGGAPIDGYLQTPGAVPIALPGQAGGQWLSFPCFSQNRNPDRNAQEDTANVREIDTTESEEFFGVLLDTNLDIGYLPSAPGSGGAESLRTLLVGEHQCLVAQIEFAGTPIPSGARPSTSDKLAQRNIAISEVANPGMTASRAAFHTFEIEATPHPITDELLLDWSLTIPDGSYARIHLPGWKVEDVLALADRFYPRHEIRAVDAHTVEIPGGGMRYVPLPKCLYRRTGVLTVELPLGIKKGQRFDVSVRQISNRGRNVKFPESKTQQITLEEAGRLLAEIRRPGTAARVIVERGVFDLGNNRSLVTDLSVFDAFGDHAPVIEHPAPEAFAAARAQARMWRETVGAFQLGIPVSTRNDMLLYYLRLFSLMSWRLSKMSRNSRWYPTMTHYVLLLQDKVQALGGNPIEVPATPDGAIPQLPWVGGGDPSGPGGGSPGSTDPFQDIIRKLAYPWGCLLLVLLILILLWVLLI